MNRCIYLVLVGLFCLNFSARPTYGQETFGLSVTLPEQLEQIELKAKTSLLNTDKRPFSDVIPFQVIDGVLIAEGKISGPAEFVMLNSGDLSCLFVIEAGMNEFNLYHDSDSNQLSIETIIGPITANATLHKIDALYDDYLQRYGEIVVTEPHGTRRLILNKLDKIKDFLMDKIALLRHSPPSYYSLIEYLAISSGSLDLKHIEQLSEAVSELPPDLQSTPLGRALSYDLHATISSIKSNYIGQPVPIFSVEDEYGLNISNANFAGSPYIVAFSATWCVPCQVYQKKLQELYTQYHARGLEVIYFNLDSDTERWHEHISKNELTWINVSEKTKMQHSMIAKQFNVTTIPNYILIDQKGQIIYNDKHMNDPDFDQLESYLRQALEVEEFESPQRISFK